jgi:hypothetical protein
MHWWWDADPGQRARRIWKPMGRVGRGSGCFGASLTRLEGLGKFLCRRTRIRNRIVRGISVGVLGSEAAEHSGTRIAAGARSSRRGRFFASPGKVTNKIAWSP